MKLLREVIETGDQIAEATNHMGERTQQTFAGWKRACKQASPDVWFDGDADICNAMVGPNPYVRGETKSIGDWDGAQGSIYVKETKSFKAWLTGAEIIK